LKIQGYLFLDLRVFFGSFSPPSLSSDSVCAVGFEMDEAAVDAGSAEIVMVSTV
jgi:hypothetical protein